MHPSHGQAKDRGPVVRRCRLLSGWAEPRSALATAGRRIRLLVLERDQLACAVADRRPARVLWLPVVADALCIGSPLCQPPGCFSFAYVSWRQEIIIKKESVYPGGALDAMPVPALHGD